MHFRMPLFMYSGLRFAKACLTSIRLAKMLLLITLLSQGKHVAFLKEAGTTEFKFFFFFLMFWSAFSSHCGKKAAIGPHDNDNLPITLMVLLLTTLVLHAWFVYKC